VDGQPVRSIGDSIKHQQLFRFEENLFDYQQHAEELSLLLLSPRVRKLVQTRIRIINCLWLRVTFMHDVTVPHHINPVANAIVKVTMIDIHK